MLRIKKMYMDVKRCCSSSFTFQLCALVHTYAVAAARRTALVWLIAAENIVMLLQTDADQSTTHLSFFLPAFDVVKRKAVLLHLLPKLLMSPLYFRCSE